jgi:hypothetical protein
LSQLLVTDHHVQPVASQSIEEASSSDVAAGLQRGTIDVPESALLSRRQAVGCTRADASAGFRAGWARLARFVRPRLREWEARWFRAMAQLLGHERRLASRRGTVGATHTRPHTCSHLPHRPVRGRDGQASGAMRSAAVERLDAEIDIEMPMDSKRTSGARGRLLGVAAATPPSARARPKNSP